MSRRIADYSRALRLLDLGQVASGALGATLARARTLAQHRAPRQSGALAASIRTRAASNRGDPTGGLVAGNGRVPYARIHEEGGVVEGRPWLRFRTARGWAQVRRVVIPARPYLKPALAQAARETLAIEVSRRMRRALEAA